MTFFKLLHLANALTDTNSQVRRTSSKLTQDLKASSSNQDIYTSYSYEDAFSTQTRFTCLRFGHSRKADSPIDLRFPPVEVRLVMLLHCLKALSLTHVTRKVCPPETIVSGITTSVGSPTYPET